MRQYLTIENAIVDFPDYQMPDTCFSTNLVYPFALQVKGIVEGPTKNFITFR